MRVFRGLNITFSWKRFLGITKFRRKVAKKIGFPTTKDGFNRKIGRDIINLIKNK